MNVRIELAGFGDDRPAAFGGKDEVIVAMEEIATVAAALAAIGLNGVPGLAVLLNNRSVGDGERGTTRLQEGDHVVVLYALEGG